MGLVLARSNGAKRDMDRNLSPRSVLFDKRDVSVTQFHFGGILAEIRLKFYKFQTNVTAQVCLSQELVKTTGVQPLDVQSEKDASLCLTTSY